MKRLTFGICAVACLALAANAKADNWGGSSCATRDRDFADTPSDGTAANADTRAQLSFTVDSRGGTDVSVQVGDPPQEHHNSHFWHHGYEAGDSGCMPRHYRRLGPN
jgi:hypothetical protein